MALGEIGWKKPYTTQKRDAPLVRSLAPFARLPRIETGLARLSFKHVLLYPMLFLRRVFSEQKKMSVLLCVDEVQANLGEVLVFSRHIITLLRFAFWM